MTAENLLAQEISQALTSECEDDQLASDQKGQV